LPLAKVAFTIQEILPAQIKCLVSVEFTTARQR